jgi:GAF domain-containing protein
MKAAALPANETDRLKSLAAYQILDTLPEGVYDDITRIACEIAGTPIALLSLIDSNRHWVKSSEGLDVREIPREYSFCAHAILNPDEMLVVEDTRYDERFHDNPLTKSDPGVIFYAGVPIVNDGGFALGSLCIIDSRPRTLTDNKLMALKALAKLVMAHFELRKTKLELERIHQEFIKASQSQAPSHLSMTDQAHGLVQNILANVQTLVANGAHPDQASQLASLKESAHALKTALDH